MTVEMTSLGDLAQELNIKRSQLLYYKSCGLLTPLSVAGRTNIFDKKKTLAAIEKIKKLQDEGKSLKEIKTLM